jgi:hypothetical protein
VAVAVVGVAVAVVVGVAVAIGPGVVVAVGVPVATAVGVAVGVPVATAEEETPTVSAGATTLLVTESATASKTVYVPDAP